MTVFRQQGDIGVRCSNSHSALWFHLGQDSLFRIATENIFNGYTNLRPGISNEARIWTELTHFGTRLIRPILDLPGIRDIDVRPFHLDIDLKDEALWRERLPQIIDIFRNTMGIPEAVVYHYPASHNVDVEWHLPLLEQFA